jgi:hypothetical protein
MAALLSAFQSVTQYLSGIPIIGSLPGVQNAAMFSNWLQSILQYLQGIWNNTAPQPTPTTGNLNQWFMGDVLAITGRRY